MYTVGIDLGGTNVAIGICDKDLKIIDKGSVPTPTKDGADAIVEAMAKLTQDILLRNSISPEEISSIGVAIPGSVDSKNGIIVYTPNVPFKNYPFSEAFGKYFPNTRLLLENDANAAALGEALVGSARGAKSCVTVTLGTGVGGGIILDGKIFSGGLNSHGAELGHTVISVGGRPCGCGRRGCFEAYASATALTKMTEERMAELSEKGISSRLFDAAKLEGKVSAKTAFDAMKQGDSYGKEIVSDYIYYLATGITNIINIFQPEVVAIGGGVCNERENLTAPLIKLVDSEQYTRDNAVRTKIVIAELGNDAGIIGAAALGR